MNKATRVYSAEQGYFSEKLEATHVKSYAHARKLAPFVDDKGQMVYWVNWGALKKNNRPRVAHFKHYPKNSKTINKLVAEEIKDRFTQSLESKEHKLVKDVIVDFLRKRIADSKSLPWAFDDPAMSHYSLSGDILADAISVEKEYPIRTPFGEQYRLDVAVLGKPITKNPIVLAGIEIEFSHKFDFSKSLVLKALGFPLMSIDIAEVNVNDINEEWAKQAIIETTKNSLDGFRRNYIYIHKMLSTVYLDIDRKVSPESRHQYVIFTKEQNRFERHIKLLKDKLEITDQQLNIQIVSDINKQTHLQVKNAGNLAGDSWQDHNPKSFIQLTIDKPCTKSGNLYLFHLVLCSLCNSIFDCLVGYKYEKGERHEVGDSLFWNRYTGLVNGEAIYQKIAPKRVSEPVMQIISHVENRSGSVEALTNSAGEN
ncbi:MAG: hypothetical protein BVN35_12260 [Proteobacteria bacterium ST_bin11]|nr:MAG: hypothetical protein BVN35_12260 [Proteobacteria bacterium ST_bin11]